MVRKIAKVVIANKNMHTIFTEFIVSIRSLNTDYVLREIPAYVKTYTLEFNDDDPHFSNFMELAKTRSEITITDTDPKNAHGYIRALASDRAGSIQRSIASVQNGIDDAEKDTLKSAIMSNPLNTESNLDIPYDQLLRHHNNLKRMYDARVKFLIHNEMEVNDINIRDLHGKHYRVVPRFTRLVKS